MSSRSAQLIRGLEAQDWRETASITPDWRRFGKFGRGAAYVILHDCTIGACSQPKGVIHLREGELWFGPLHKLSPELPVVGPTLEQVLAAGASSIKQDAVDSTALLVELLDTKKDGQ